MRFRLAICLLLLGASLPLAARDVRQSGANGDGGSCPEVLAADEAATPARGAARRVPANAGDRPAVRGGDSQGVRPPRWHSFLPGMFR
jgi:hypothetical protein